jgi:hypothetical protein
MLGFVPQPNLREILGKRQEVFSDFTFLYTVWFFDADLLILVIFLINNLMKKNVEMFHGTSLQVF